MPRSYHVEIAAIAAAADSKWVDNLLSHFTIPGVESARQGVARRISLTGVQHIALARILSRELGLPIGGSVSLASRLLAAADHEVEIASTLRLALDRQAFESEIARLVSDAAETTAPARRGRRPIRTAVD